MGISSESHVGKYNVFRDPIVYEQGIVDKVRQVLSGKAVFIQDLTAPYPDMIKYFNVADQDIQALYLDIVCFPLFKPDQTLGCFIAVFFIKKIYRFRDEIQRAKEYIKENWREKYDAGETAKAANLSKHHFSQLFKKHVGMTPHDYYISVKIRNIQECLRDESLTVSEAFTACGVNYHGHFAAVFKKKVGLTPTKYRASVMQEKGL
ncbi:HTH-type transcriptional activator RhaR [bioreactor metagenome]|uniref:HTH-type transcriptional activator RhaR n=1 Tax=bioreactor metagenome TaxID=1076179 RepID=A0A645GNE1_9ZZZZ